MALDTRQKRMSVPGCGRPWLRAQDNDATLAQAWRQSVGNIYAGNLVGSVLIILSRVYQRLRRRRR